MFATVTVTSASLVVTAPARHRQRAGWFDDQQIAAARSRLSDSAFWVSPLTRAWRCQMSASVCTNLKSSLFQFGATSFEVGLHPERNTCLPVTNSSIVLAVEQNPASSRAVHATADCKRQCYLEKKLEAPPGFESGVLSENAPDSSEVA